MGKKEGKELTVSKRVTITRTLPVELGPEEYRATSRNLAQHIEELARTQDEKKATVGGFTQRIESLNSTIAELTSVVSSGKRWMAVECIETNNYDTGYVEMIRIDTGEVVESRPMGLEDRQAGLFERGEDMAPVADEQVETPPAEEGTLEEPPLPDNPTLTDEQLAAMIQGTSEASAVDELDVVPELGDVFGEDEIAESEGEESVEDEEETGETDDGDPEWD